MKPDEPIEQPAPADANRLDRFSDDLGDGASVVVLGTFGQVVADVPDGELERDTEPPTDEE